MQLVFQAPPDLPMHALHVIRGYFYPPFLSAAVAAVTGAAPLARAHANPSTTAGTNGTNAATSVAGSKRRGEGKNHY